MVLTFPGSSARNNGRNPPDQGVQVKRRLSALDRNRAAWPKQRVAVTALQFQIAVTDEVQIPDVRGGGVVEREIAMDAEVDADPRAAVDELDVGDLADLYARGADELATV